MKNTRAYPFVTVTKKAENSILNGHPWVYEGEILSTPEDAKNGALVDVLSPKNTYLGTGLISLNSKIRVRLISQNANDCFDEAFFERRVRWAIEYRKTVMGEKDFNCCRLIFGEADLLPGVTVDRYGPLLVTQIASYGMEQRKDIIYKALVNVLSQMGVTIDGIYERNDLSLRTLEGLSEGKGWYEGPFVGVPATPLTDIVENGITYTVDVENGQKTGFFLDQKYNRAAVAKIAKGKKVLDCFTHTGSFALNAALGGAEHVTAVDVSETAVAMAKENAKRNGLDRKMDFICDDVFSLLPKLCEEKADYDMIILDPPAFTKSRKTVMDAKRGYKEINYRAMKLLPRGGYLATCSCSHFMENELFEKMLISAAKDAKVSLRLIESRKQSPDHPILINVPETDYLKFYLFQVV